jgi:hypothetical protein
MLTWSKVIGSTLEKETCCQKTIRLYELCELIMTTLTVSSLARNESSAAIRPDGRSSSSSSMTSRNPSGARSRASATPGVKSGIFVFGAHQRITKWCLPLLGLGLKWDALGVYFWFNKSLSTGRLQIRHHRLRLPCFEADLPHFYHRIRPVSQIAYYS